MAIAFDFSTQGSVSAATSLTYSHTCTGSNRILFVHVRGDNVSDLVTGATYNGVAMTLINKIFVATNRWQYLFYIIAPATSANNIVVNASSACDMLAESASYIGASQSSQPDASTTNSVIAGNTTMTTSVTTVADKCWTVMGAGASGGSLVASTGSFLRQVGANTGSALFDSNGTVTPAGSKSMIITFAVSAANCIMASFSPAASTIDFDNAVDLGNSSSGSLTTAFTTTGSNRMLFVGGWGGTGASNWTGVTYNGVAMTKVGERQVSGDRWVYLYMLAAPASGSHNIVISESGVAGIDAWAASYTGANQVSTPDASAVANATATNTSASVTTIANNCWTIMSYKQAGAGGTAGSGTVQRINTANGSQIYDSNSATTPAGVSTLNVNHSSIAYALVIASFAPIAGTTNSGFLEFM